MFASGARLLRTRVVSSTTVTTAIAVAMLVLWLAGVVFTTLSHEYWRDEVRALSLARAATSPFDLYGLIQYDGHPVLWYLLLFIGTSLADSPLILPIASAAVAMAAVALFVWRSPFELWVKGVFIFGALPFYEYSVVARNYGMSMLLLFLAAVWYRERFTRPVRLAVVLALLANTNVHAGLLAGTVTALWAWEVVRDTRVMTRDRRMLFAGSLFIIILGLALCAAFTWPREDSAIVSRTFTAQEVAIAMARVAAHPGSAFGALMPHFIPSWVTSLLLLGSIIGLAKRPRFAVAALAGMLTLGVLFTVVYPGAYRHQGLLLIFFIFLYWLALDAEASAPYLRPEPLRGVGLHGAVVILMLAALVDGRYFVKTDSHRPMSSSKALAELLHREYRNAILVAEPGYLAESLPFYVRNRIYIPRERRFGTTVMWTTLTRRLLTLSELVDAADEVAKQERRPVLILLGHREVRYRPAGARTFPYQKHFRWTQADRDHLASSTHLVADFASAVGDENYSVYALLPEQARASVVGARPARHSPPQFH